MERTRQRSTPGVMIGRLSGPLAALLAQGVARYGDDDVIELVVTDANVETGGMATISMRVPVRCEPCEKCGGTGAIEELFSAWLAIPPGVADGVTLAPSVQLPGVIEPVMFRARRQKI